MGISGDGTAGANKLWQQSISSLAGAVRTSHRGCQAKLRACASRCIACSGSIAQIQSAGSRSSLAQVRKETGQTLMAALWLLKMGPRALGRANCTRKFTSSRPLTTSGAALAFLLRGIFRKYSLPLPFLFLLSSDPGPLSCTHIVVGRGSSKKIHARAPWSLSMGI